MSGGQLEDPAAYDIMQRLLIIVRQAPELSFHPVYFLWMPDDNWGMQNASAVSRDHDLRFDPFHPVFVSTCHAHLHEGYDLEALGNEALPLFVLVELFNSSRPLETKNLSY